MQNGLKRMRTDPSVNNGNISDPIQDFPLSSGLADRGGGGTAGNGSSKQTSANSQKNHPLYSRGMCTWAGCETNCDTYTAFLVHLNREHLLDERTTAQTRVQVLIIFDKDFLANFSADFQVIFQLICQLIC